MMDHMMRYSSSNGEVDTMQPSPFDVYDSGYAACETGIMEGDRQMVGCRDGLFSSWVPSVPSGKLT